MIIGLVYICATKSYWNAQFVHTHIKMHIVQPKFINLISPIIKRTPQHKHTQPNLINRSWMRKPTDGSFHCAHSLSISTDQETKSFTKLYTHNGNLPFAQLRGRGLDNRKHCPYKLSYQVRNARYYISLTIMWIVLCAEESSVDVIPNYPSQYSVYMVATMSGQNCICANKCFWSWQKSTMPVYIYIYMKTHKTLPLTLFVLNFSTHW